MLADTPNRPNFQAGDKVRIRKPWRVKKGEPKFTTPRTVVNKKGPNTYLLDDGRTWNASRLSALPELTQETNSDRVLDSSRPETEKPTDGAQLRPPRKPPNWTKDLDMG